MPLHKLPAFQFYPGDWWKDPGVQALSCEERGVWFQCLLIMHEASPRGYLALNGQPFPLDALARLMGLTEGGLRGVMQKVIDWKIASVDDRDGTTYSRRMVRDETTRRTRAEGGKEGASFGEMGASFGKLGGRPKKITPQETPLITPLTPSKITPLKPPPSSSSSSSSSFSEEIPPLAALAAPQGAEQKPARVKFTPPTRPEIIDFLADEWGIKHAEQIGMETADQVSIEIDKFMDHFGALGWRMRSGPMKDWRKAFRNWVRRVPDFAPRPAVVIRGRR